MALGKLILALTLVSLCRAEGPPPTANTAVRGTLVQREGQSPALETAEHKLIPLDGDTPTQGVLNDKRLAGADLTLKGHFNSGRFAVDPMHTKAMLAHKGGKAYRITYWCDLCAIRTYSPGVCVCCQQETQLDLRDPDIE